MSILYAFVVVCALMGVAAWALNRRSLRRVPTVFQFKLYLDRGPERYRHLPRLFAPEDFSFLERTPGGERLIPRLRRSRRHMLRLVLADLRRDFEALMAVGSLLALSPTAADDGFAVMLWRQSVCFYSLFFTLQVYSFWPLTGMVSIDPAPLLRQVETLRHATKNLMRALTPDDLAHLRNSLTAH